MIVSVARGDGPFGWLGQRSGTFHAFHAEEVPKWFLFLAVGLVLYVAVAPGRGDRDHVRPRVVMRRGRANPAVRRCDAPDDRSDAARRRGRERVVRRRPGRQPERALRLLRRAAGVRRDGTVDRERSAAATALVAAPRLPSPASPPCSCRSAGSTKRWASGARARPLATLAPSAGATAALVAATTLCFALVWMTCSERTTWRLWTLVAVWMAVLGLFVVESNRVSASRTAAAFDGRAATWVDDALPRGSDVAVLWDEKQARKNLPDSFYFWLMVTEFFNSSVGGVYRLGPATFYEDFLPTVPARLGRGQAVVGRDGRPVRVEYALVTCRTPIRGDVVARAPHDALLVVHVDGPLRLSASPPAGAHNRRGCDLNRVARARRSSCRRRRPSFDAHAGALADARGRRPLRPGTLGRGLASRLPCARSRRSGRAPRRRRARSGRRMRCGRGGRGSARGASRRCRRSPRA